MKLTNKDKKYLFAIGYNSDDFISIEDATKNMKYELFFPFRLDGTFIKLNQKQVVDIIGRTSFLSGLARATFHQTAVKTPNDLPIGIYFEKTKF
jgi:hypothetical protein